MQHHAFELLILLFAAKTYQHALQSRNLGQMGILFGPHFCCGNVSEFPQRWRLAQRAYVYQRFHVLEINSSQFQKFRDVWDRDDIPQSLQKQVLQTAQRRNNAEVPQTSDLPELQIFQALLPSMAEKSFIPPSLTSRDHI